MESSVIQVIRGCNLNKDIEGGLINLNANVKLLLQLFERQDLDESYDKLEKIDNVVANVVCYFVDESTKIKRCEDINKLFKMAYNLDILQDRDFIDLNLDITLLIGTKYGDLARSYKRGILKSLKMFGELETANNIAKITHADEWYDFVTKKIEKAEKKRLEEQSKE
jgi:hypothetical protein